MDHVVTDTNEARHLEVILGRVWLKESVFPYGSVIRWISKLFPFSRYSDATPFCDVTSATASFHSSSALVSFTAAFSSKNAIHLALIAASASVKDV